MGLSAHSWEQKDPAKGCRNMGERRAGTRDTSKRSAVSAFVGPLVLTAFLFVVVWASVRAPSAPPRPVSTPELGALVDPQSVYDPVQSRESLPDGFRQVLRRDGILPIYDPSFVSGRDCEWSPETLVLGVEIGGEAKAYPIGTLNRREMVVDSLAGIPILVSW